VILFVLLLLLYVLAKCGCCCFGGWAKSPPGCATRISWVAIILFGLASVGIGYASAGPANTMGTAAVGAINAVVAFGSAAGTAVQRAQTARNDAAAFGTIAASIADAFDAKVPPVDSTGFRQAATIGSGSSSDSANATSIMSEAAKAATDVDKLAGSQAAYVGNSGLGIAVVNGSILIIFLLTLLPWSLCKCAHTCVSPLLLVLVLLIWVICGVLALLAVISSDLCFDFNTNMERVLTNNGPALKSTAPSVLYYLNCQDTPGYSFNGTSYAVATQALEQLNSSRSDIQALGAFRTHPQVTPAEALQIDSMLAAFDVAVVSTEAVASSLGCSGFGRVFATARTELCTNFVDKGFTMFWVMEAACAVCIALILVFK
jgi:hypothetical protein